MNENIKGTLEKQLQLLAERSKEDGSDIQGLSHAMCEVARQLQSLSDDAREARGYLATVQMSGQDLIDLYVGQYEREHRQQESAQRI